MFKTKTLKIIFYFLIISFYFLIVTHAFAQSFNLPPPKAFDFEAEILKFACWLVRIIIMAMVIFLLISGVRFLLAQGDQDVIAAKKNFMQALIGILIILGANVIIASITYLLGGDAVFLGIDCAPRIMQL